MANVTWLLVGITMLTVEPERPQHRPAKKLSDAVALFLSPLARGASPSSFTFVLELPIWSETLDWHASSPVFDELWYRREMGLPSLGVGTMMSAAPDDVITKLSMPGDFTT